MEHTIYIYIFVFIFTESTSTQVRHLNMKMLPLNYNKMTFALGLLRFIPNGPFLCNVAIISHQHAVGVFSCVQNYIDLAMEVVHDSVNANDVYTVKEVKVSGPLVILAVSSPHKVKDLTLEHLHKEHFSRELGI